MRKMHYTLKKDIDHIFSRLTESLIEHMASAAEMSEYISKKYDQNIENSSVSARYHDIFRHISDEEARGLVEMWDVSVDKFEYDTGVGLLHGPLASHYLAEYGFADDIVEAVRYHTTGKCGLCNTGKVLVIADTVEPLRTGEEVDIIREMIGEVRLDELYKISVRYKVRKLRNKGIEEIHGRTLDLIGGNCE